MILSFERSVFEESVEGWGRDRAGNGGVEGGAVYKAIAKVADATSVCVSCSYCLASYIYCRSVWAQNVVNVDP